MHFSSQVKHTANRLNRLASIPSFVIAEPKIPPFLLSRTFGSEMTPAAVSNKLMRLNVDVHRCSIYHIYTQNVQRQGYVLLTPPYLPPVLVGVIGGSGLYHLDNLTVLFVPLSILANKLQA